MVFTILLTSFALLLLALSDAVGNFSSVNAQYKAAEELQEQYAGVRYQYIDDQGNVIYTGMDTQIKDADIIGVSRIIIPSFRSGITKYSSCTLRA